MGVKPNTNEKDESMNVVRIRSVPTGMIYDLSHSFLREDRKMSLDDFTNNLRGVDSGKNFDPKLLKSIYKGIKKQEFIGGPDHVIQTQLIQNSILGAKRPNLAEPHRRLVCLCR